MSRIQKTYGVFAVLVLFGLAFYFWNETDTDRVSAPATAQSSPPPESQEKIKMTKEGLPAPVAPGLTPQDYKPYGEASLLELFMTSIEFYGKVVDEKGNPIAGATAKMSVAEKPITNGAKYTKTTDDRGLFSLTGLTGAAVAVDVTKEGYYTTEQSSGMVRFGKFRSDTDPQIPTAGEPTVFTLRKKGEAYPLVVRGLSQSIARDGKPIEISLETGRLVADGQLGIKIEAWTNDDTKNALGRYDWKSRISVPGGGLIERKDALSFEAPADGYKPFDEIDMPRTAERWKPQESREYFVKLADGRFARVRLEMVAGGDNFVSISSFLNPTPGNRNLEFDPAKAVKSP